MSESLIYFVVALAVPWAFMQAYRMGKRCAFDIIESHLSAKHDCTFKDVQQIIQYERDRMEGRVP